MEIQILFLWIYKSNCSANKDKLGIQLRRLGMHSPLTQYMQCIVLQWKYKYICTVQIQLSVLYWQGELSIALQRILCWVLHCIAEDFKLSIALYCSALYWNCIASWVYSTPDLAPSLCPQPGTTPPSSTSTPQHHQHHIHQHRHHHHYHYHHLHHYQCHHHQHHSIFWAIPRFRLFRPFWGLPAS